MEAIANVKALRKRVAATKTVEDGTVVKFTYNDLAYVALFVAGAWWTSATSGGYRVNEKLHRRDVHRAARSRRRRPGRHGLGSALIQSGYDFDELDEDEDDVM